MDMGLRIAELEEPSAGTADWNSIGSYEGLAAWAWHGRSCSLWVYTATL